MLVAPQVWDTRQLKSPVHTFTDLPASLATTECGFSPDESLLITAVSAEREGQAGGVAFFDRARLELVRRVAVPGSATAVRWHPRLNQVRSHYLFGLRNMQHLVRQYHALCKWIWIDFDRHGFCLHADPSGCWRPEGWRHAHPV